MKFEDLKPGLRVEIRDLPSKPEWHPGEVRSVSTRVTAEGTEVIVAVKWHGRSMTSFIRDKPRDLERVRMPVPAESVGIVAAVAEAIGGWYPNTKPDLERCLNAIRSQVNYIKLLQNELNGPRGVSARLESMTLQAEVNMDRYRTMADGVRAIAKKFGGTAIGDMTSEMLCIHYRALLDVTK